MQFFPTHGEVGRVGDHDVRLSLIIIALATQGCASIQLAFNQDRVDAQFVVPRDGARSSDVRIDTRGDLSVRSGACSLVQARAQYDANRATVSAEHVQDESGNSVVDIKLGTEEAVLFHTSLDVCLSTELPLTLSTKLYSDDAALDLSGVQLRGLDMVAGTGDMLVDLGDATIATAAFSLETGTGDVEIDAKRASWTGENTLQIAVGTGDVTVYLPRGIGIEVEVESGVGEVDVRGLEIDEDREVHRNTLAATASDQLHVEIESGTGDVTVIAG